MEPTKPTGRVLAGTDLPSTSDRPGPVGRPDESDRDRLVTLAEAANLSGLSSEAIRLRIRRKTLWSTRGNDGRTMVRVRDLADLPPARLVASDRSSMDDQPDPSRLWDRVESLEKLLEVERQERIEVAGKLVKAEAERDAERRRAAIAEGRAAFLDQETQEVQALANQRAEEIAQLRERTGRAEAEREAAEVARRALEATATRAERRQDALEEELREARRPLWERVVKAIRGRE